MCGLAGFCDFTKQHTLHQLKFMTDAMTHRGPDSSNYRLYEHHSFNVGLGHRRLAILDLTSNGSQPMSFMHLHIVLNGEVYNFKEIRAQLQQSGYSFQSESDTEVVLKAFHCWGFESVKRFIGMFAFSIFDEKANKIYLIRDRAGVKPLYYYHTKDFFAFGSELKALVASPLFTKKISNIAVSHYFRLGYIPAPHSIYENIYKLPPAHYLEFDITNHQLQLNQYWNVADYYNAPKVELTEQEILANLESILTSAFQYRTISDVPVGVFLSGGYDSSTLAALLQKQSRLPIKTYTIGFAEKKYDESVFAAAIAKHLGTDHATYICTPDDVRNTLQVLPEMFDEPFGDSSAIPTYLVSKIARQHVTVALSADAGDETFGGYTRYDTLLAYRKQFAYKSKTQQQLTNLGLYAIHAVGKNVMYNLSTRIEKIREIIHSRHDGEILRAVSAINTLSECKALLKHFDDELPYGFDVNKLFPHTQHPLDRFMAMDYLTYMNDDILVKVDRASMFVSLESREPLLDHRIIEFVATLPVEWKIRNGVKKYLLKKIAHQYIPEHLLDRPKSGFAMPVFEWLKKDLKDMLNDLLDSSLIAQQGILNPVVVNQLKEDYFAGKNINAQKLWLLLSFQMWYHKWMT
jgi:asparagine synthase (glutamine-hydrolysing)